MNQKKYLNFSMNCILKKVIPFLLLLVNCQLFAQNRNDNFFKSGEKVNFIGNSITHGGEFHSYIYLYYATRFPSQEVTFYNSGIWGDHANNFLKRMDKDILQNKSDYAVVMAGMNDVNRTLYAAEKQKDPTIEIQKQKALSDYQQNLEKVIKRLKEEDLKIIIQKPSIYEQTAKLQAANMFGVNDALAKCCVIIDSLAKKYDLPVVDYYTIMNSLNSKLQEKDSSATIVSSDRIHPATAGNFIMAYEFLRATKSPEIVSSVELKSKKIIAVQNCEVTNISKSKKELKFFLQQESLPFPVPEKAMEVADMLDFNNQLNKEFFKVTGLKKGTYDLFIDNEKIATFSSAEFAKGINLANCKNTPQYIQAERVAEKVAAYRTSYRGLRDVKIVEINFLPKEFYEADYQTIKAYTDKLVEENNPIYKKNTYYFNLYFKSKPKEAELIADLTRLRKEIYTINQPVLHQYSIRATE